MGKENYSYPLLPEWTTTEIITVCEFYAEIEKLYMTGTSKEEFMRKYRTYLEIVPTKMLQKRLDREFEKLSGYSIYRATKLVEESKKKVVKG